MQIKDWSRNKKEAMMRGDWVEVSRLAQSKTPIARPERFVLGQDSSVKGQPDNSYPPRTFSRVRSDPVEGSEHDKPAEASTGSARTDSWLSVQPLLVASEAET